MAIGVVSANAFDEEMRVLGIVKTVEQNANDEIRDLVRGRGNAKAVPMGLRALIAVEKAAGASNAELAEEFNVSESSVSAYGHGATSTSTYHEPHDELTKPVEDFENQVIGRAQSKLLKALDSISDLKLSESKPTVAAGVARDMSNIIKNLRPDAGVTVNNNKIIVFKPRVREEDEFEVVQILDE